MQSAASLSQDIFRIVFRRGSLQRVQFTNQRLLTALLLSTVLLVGVQLWFFQTDVLDAGLLLFVVVSGLLIATSMLTWKVPRKRLMTAVLTVLLICCGGLALLLVAALLATTLLPSASIIKIGLPIVLGLVAWLGISNCLQYALACSRPKAFVYTLAFGLILALLYSTLQGLLAVVFS